MAASVQSFEEYSRRVVERFLHSVVVFDDEADIGAPDAVLVPTTLKTPAAPGRSPSGGGERAKNGKPPTSLRAGAERMGAGQDTETTDHQPSSGGRLDAKQLIDACAETGLICAVLKPVNVSDDTHRVINAARRADVVVLDWAIKKDDGHTACAIIKTLLDEDRGETRRLRLVVIYTLNNDSVSMLENVRKTARDWCPDEVAPRFALRNGPVRLTLAFKSNTRVVPELEARVVPEAKLPALLVQDFTQMSAGLLSNVALDAVAAIRRNTHRLLGRFDSMFDAAYLTHRGLLINPADAERHVVPLIASEIESILSCQRLESHVRPERFHAWLSHVRPNELLSPTELKSSRLPTKEEWLEFVERGHTPKDNKAVFKADHFTALTSADATCADEGYAILTSVETRYEKSTPQLTLGVIVARTIENPEGGKQDNEYLICVQPRCDSARVPIEGRAFPFLRAQKVSDRSNQDKFRIIIEETSQRVRLNYKPAPPGLFYLSFRPDGVGSSPIVGREIDGEWFFETWSDRSELLRWVCNLKPMFAQRIAHELGENFSRVGLTESEWLRLRAKG